MPFNFYLLRGLRLLLFPFSLVYGLAVYVRNRLYDWQWFKSASFNLPMICVGNLSVGGTGKSPMTEMLTDWLRQDFKVATLSRGYKRKTKGYLLADATTTALEIGGEPMQFHLKFPEVAVAVGEERLEAIPQLLHDRPETQVVILDDAFQHRRVVAGMNILLTEYGNPYWYDWYLPSGDLRDDKRSAARAQVIVVTKCPPDLGIEQRNTLLQRIKPLPHQKVFFSSLQYGSPYHILTGKTYDLQAASEILLVCGIANPAPLKQHLDQQAGTYDEICYNDHHIFSIDDLQQIRHKFDELESVDKIILTTEKDAVRLVKFGSELNNLPFYVQPVRHQVLFGDEEKFRSLVTGYVSGFAKAKN
ncbi:MAG: tetraacyldisaccharide 4'-kinase [Chitinophagaceae bacterium]|jgi:tetraacyldisaccharide 4'-kinase|nr:tetraacyldisaccharide 4'-kinase [Chitinophagaceae bacterium]